jgi:uncharacterized protein (TIGR02145 family)
MKRLVTLLMLSVFFMGAFSQAPQKMSYQAVIRNSTNVLVANHAVGMKISILQGSATGTEVYVETQTPTTNANGLVTIEIGNGTVVTGTFSGIDWSNGVYFIKTETDPSGGTNYTISGTSQLLSVPFALYSAKAGNSFSGSYLDLTNRPSLFDGTWTSLTGKPTLFDGKYSSLTDKPILFDGTWTSLTSKPTTIAGYGITDAFNGKWSNLTEKPTTITGYGITDFDFTGAAANDLLKFDGTKWVKFSPTYITTEVDGSVTNEIEMPNDAVDGDLAYFNGTKWIRVPKGNEGQILSIHSGIPVWENGIAYSSPLAPNVTTQSATSVLMSTANLNGSANANGFSTTVQFEYGTTTSYGTVVTANQSPVTGFIDTNVSKGISTLLANTTYHYRLKTSNAVGVTYGNDMTFLTLGAVPTATTTASSGTTTTGTTLNGTVNANGFSSTVTFEYGLTTAYGSFANAIQSPVTGNSNTNVSVSLSGLATGTTFHYRVNAANSLGTTNGNDLTFTTLGAVPTATTNAATSIVADGATLNGSVNANYLSSTVSFEYGLTTGYGSTATATQSPVTGSSNTSVSASISGLTGGTTYHYRVKATNSLGATNGGDMTFTTLGAVPTATTTAATSIVADGATFNGTVNANYLSTTVSFEYGLTASYGTIITSTPSTVTGNASTNVSASVSGLAGGTIYHYRVRATNSSGTANGSDLTFTTIGALPTASTTAITSISTTGATVNGTVNANYLLTTVSFEYGTTTSYGSTTTATPSMATGSTSTNISASLTGLVSGTTYHYRVKAVNSLGTTYGSDITFITVPITISDIDLNTYNVVAIGTQIWMAENLKTTKFSDGTAIPLITDNSAWAAIYNNSLTTPAYCWLNNDLANKTTFGGLYNWYTISSANNGNKNVCPIGWHVPTLDEYSALLSYLGNSGAGGKMKEAGTTHWTAPNVGATNESGFTALPAASRSPEGIFDGAIGVQGNWWNYTEFNSASAWFLFLYNSMSSSPSGYQNKAFGYSIRCMRDN